MKISLKIRSAMASIVHALVVFKSGLIKINNIVNLIC